MLTSKNGGVTVRVRGEHEINKAIRRHLRALGDAADRLLGKITNELFLESQFLVPVDTGDLKNSGYVLREKRGTGVSFKIVYDEKYAVFVHEMEHIFHEPPTSAKYVEIPLTRNRNRIVDEIEAHMGRVNGVR